MSDSIQIELRPSQQVQDSLAMAHAIYSRLSTDQLKDVERRFASTRPVRISPSGLRHACETIGMLLLLQVADQTNAAIDRMESDECKPEQE